MAGAHDSARLHDLLKAAARELKAAQQELADERDLHEQARKALDQERTKNRELAQQVIDAQQALRKAQAQAELAATLTRDSADGGRTLPPRSADESTNVSKLDAEVLEQRVKALDQALGDAEAEAKQHRHRIATLETELEALREVARPKTVKLTAVQAASDEQALETANDATAAAEAATRAAQAKLAALEAELASVRETAARTAELEGQLASAKTRLWEFEQRANEGASRSSDLATERDAAATKVSELAARVTQLEGELAGLRARRDELNVEVARAESERKKLAARVGELEASAQTVRADEAQARAELEAKHREAVAALEAKVAEADAALVKEKEKHQHTAQRLLEGRGRVRELETQLADVQTQLSIAATRQAEAVANTQARLDALASEHEQALAREREAQRAATSALQSHLAQVEKELAHAITEWHHTNRQYEQLHKEMLVLLDQRDEARRQLDALRSP